ncbi:fumarate hydratase C-terminal domain-containing protein [Escherichia coli]
MEAIWKIEVEDFPAFILVDDKGNDFFQQIVNKQCANCTKEGLGPSAWQHAARRSPWATSFAIVISRLLVNSQYFP